MSNITAKILHDDNQDGPREWDNLGTMACWHRNYNLGDVQPKQDPGAYIREQCPEGSVVLNLYLYDHSGITMSTGEFSCSFDSGWVGMIFVTPERIKAEYGDTSPESCAKARACLEGEVKVYDQYLTGDVWGFVLERNDSCDSCGHSEPEEIDSCWGFYGDCLEDMKGHVDDEHHAALEAAWESRF